MEAGKEQVGVGSGESRTTNAGLTRRVVRGILKPGLLRRFYVDNRGVV
jgi:hypothetical protein